MSKQNEMKNTYTNTIRILLALALIASLSLVIITTSDAAGPSITLSPTSGPIGTKVTVSFCAGSSLKEEFAGKTIGIGDITFNGIPWNSRVLELDDNRCLCGTTFTVPYVALADDADSLSVSVVINVNGVSVANQPAPQTFKVTRPGLTISPTSGYKGETITVTGTTWPQHTPGSVLVIVEGIGNAITFRKYVTPDSSGEFSTTFTAPLTDDEYLPNSSDCERYIEVYAADILGNVAPRPTQKERFCLMAASLELEPQSGPPGTSVTATGKGFQPLSSVVDFNISGCILPAPNLMTDNVGTFTTTFIAPALLEGTHAVSATVAGLTLSKCFAITEPTPPDEFNGEVATPIEDALSTISDELIRIWCYHNGLWKLYDPNDLLGSNLTGLVRGRAYWVKVEEDCTLIFRELKAGWNNIGW